jgi:hypothetical protein
LAQPWQIGSSEERRRLLVAESDRLRQQFAGELANLRPTVAWMERGYSVFHSLRSVWPWLAAAGGVLVARKGGGLFRSLGKAWSVWRLGKKLAGLWRSRTGSEQEA